LARALVEHEPDVAAAQAILDGAAQAMQAQRRDGGGQLG
jgi:hypothetical protein